MNKKEKGCRYYGKAHEVTEEYLGNCIRCPSATFKMCGKLTSKNRPYEAGPEMPAEKARIKEPKSRW